jgi:hypothetical protein
MRQQPNLHLVGWSSLIRPEAEGYRTLLLVHTNEKGEVGREAVVATYGPNDDEADLQLVQAAANAIATAINFGMTPIFLARMVKSLYGAPKSGAAIPVDGELIAVDPRLEFAIFGRKDEDVVMVKPGVETIWMTAAEAQAALQAGLLDEG